MKMGETIYRSRCHEIEMGMEIAEYLLLWTPSLPPQMGSRVSGRSSSFHQQSFRPQLSDATFVYF